MNARARLWLSPVLAALTGLALRILIIQFFAAPNNGDSPVYVQLAQNWLFHGVYGLWINGRLIPVDLRAPGYPAFLALVYRISGSSDRAVMLAQAGLDMLTCWIAAALAALLARRESRRRVALAALWLTALCPFTANYTAALLTETLTTFLTAIAILICVRAVDEKEQEAPFSFRNPWFLAGIIVGFGALVRPETPLIIISTGLFLFVHWVRSFPWKRLVLAGLLMAAGLLLPLLPWAARNWRTFHEFQPLAPRYGQLQGEYVTRGFNAWTGTWLWRMRDVYLTLWNVDDDEIHADDLPSYAFDSPAERGRVAALLDRYNEETTMTPELDRGFGEIARERTRRHPLRTVFFVPAKRVLALWFTPRIELLPFSGKLWPVGEKWDEDPVDFSVTAGLALANFLLLGLAGAGAWKSRGQPGTQLILVYAALRTLFLLTVETPEPRYVLECYPLLMALAAQVGARRALPAR